jgi:hypothetical protein
VLLLDVLTTVACKIGFLLFYPDWATIMVFYRNKLSLLSINYCNYRDKKWYFCTSIEIYCLSLYEDSFSIYIYSILYNKSPRISVLFQSCNSSFTSIVSGLSCALSQVIIRQVPENTCSGLLLITGIDRISSTKRDRHGYFFCCTSCVYYLIGNSVTLYNSVSVQ